MKRKPPVTPREVRAELLRARSEDRLRDRQEFLEQRETRVREREESTENRQLERRRKTDP